MQKYDKYDRISKNYNQQISRLIKLSVNILKFMPFTPRLSIFDLDGTLIDYEHEFLFNEAERILPLVGLGHISKEDFINQFEHDHLFGFLTNEDERRAMEEHFWKHIWVHERPDPKAIEGVIETLDSLATRGIKLAIATARAQLEEHLKEELQHTGLLKWVDIITSRDTHDDPWRDKRKQIVLACKHASSAPEDSFMIGDSPSDIWSANAVQIGCSIAVRTGRIRDEVLKKENPHAILNHAGEVISLIPEK